MDIYHTFWTWHIMTIHTLGPGCPVAPGLPVGGGDGVVLGSNISPYGGMSNPLGQPFRGS